MTLAVRQTTSQNRERPTAQMRARVVHCYEMRQGKVLLAVALAVTQSAAACAPVNVPTGGATIVRTTEHEPGASEQWSGREVFFTGMCDASGAVALTRRTMLVADDEDNVLRVYDADQGGAPTSQFNLSGLLRLPAKHAREGAPEIDIEAAARIGDRAYFITSHGRSSRGKLKPERLRFFSTNAPEDGALSLQGEPYSDLLADLLQEPQLARFNLLAASLFPPKAAGGLNIEGMTARVEGGVFLGFRNPIPEGRALLVPLLNPEGLVSGQRSRFGNPITLDLGGLGVRGLSFWRGQYLIAAGSFDATNASKLFLWQGGDHALPVTVPDLHKYNPEALFTPEGRDEIMLLSDDGSSMVGDVQCKHLSNASRKRFRGVWLKPSPGG